MREFNTFLARHHGVFARHEAEMLGITRSKLETLLRGGGVVRTQPQTYRIASAPRTWRSRMRSAVVSSVGVASHRAAGALWQLDGFPDALLELTIDNQRRVKMPGVKIHRSTQMRLIDETEIDGIAVTGIGRTILDLAAVVSARRLEMAIDSAIRKKLLDWPDLYRVLVLHSRRGRDGCGRLRKMLDVRYGDSNIPDSTWNRDVGVLLLDGGLPEPQYEFEVTNPAGGFVARVDLAYPERKIAIELDSVRWHLNRVSFEADPRRKNQLAVDGWTVLTFTWSDYINHPDALIDTVRRARSVESGAA